MSFDVAAEAYGRFMGRYSEPLAIEFIQCLQLEQGHRVLDVGCGPGALTHCLAEVVGEAAVTAVDPSASFVEAARRRLPAATIERATAEDLPFADGVFDQVLAQLVVHFMADPVRGITELARVTRPGGTVAACVWDYQGDRMPLSIFWQVVRDVDPTATTEAGLPGSGDGQLVEYFHAAGLHQVRQQVLEVSVPLAGFEDWWQPFGLGVGPAGEYVQSLDEARVNRIRAGCARLLPAGPFTLTAAAWAAIGIA